MNRSGKEAIVASIKSDFSQSEAAFLVGVKGLTVEEFSKLRKQLREKNARLQVAKVRLMKRALQDFSQMGDLNPHLNDQIAFVFATEDTSGVAKVLCDFSESMDRRLKIVVGNIGQTVYDARSIQAVASLPSREVLLAQVARALQAPTTNFVGVLHQLLARFAYTLKQIEEQKNKNS